MPSSSSTPESLEGLSPAKRALLELRLGRRTSGAIDEAIAPRHGRGPTALSFEQQRLWVLHQLTPGLAAYNVPRVLRLRGPLAVEALERALNALVDRHESLRTRFALVDGEPMQMPQAHAHLALDTVTLEAGAPEDREREALRIAIATAREPFDLAGDLLLRARLVRLATDDHLLVLVTHHIASDEASKAVLFEDLAELYAAFRAGESARLPRPALQYADYAHWQRGAGAPDADQIAWWRKRLSGAPSGLELPFDRPRPAIQSHAGARYLAHLDPLLTAEVLRFARAERATPFMVLLAALAALLARLTGERDLVIGVPVSLREQPELARVIGCFANTVAMRIDAGDDPTFAELVAATRTTAIDALAHRLVPFERVVNAVAPVRDLSRSPLFGVMFNHFDGRAGDGAAALAGVEVEQVDIDPGVAKFDLGLIASDASEGTLLEWEFSSALFDRSSIEALHGRWERVLRAGIADRDTRLSALPLLSGGEERGLLSRGRGAPAQLPADSCVHTLISATAVRTPSAIAVESHDGSLTYGELERQANHLAHRLLAQGIGRGSLVGVCMERSARLPVALLAVLKAGAAYVPLDPRYPRERLRLMLEDAEVPLVLSESGLAQRLPRTGATLLFVDDELAAGSNGEDTTPASGVTPDDLAYVIYTSGSTGRPKGVMIEHRSVVNFLLSMASEPGLGATDVMLAITTLSFDIAVLELYLPLLQGARVVIAASDETDDPDRLIDAIDRTRPTVMQATPATWRMLLEVGWTGCPGLRILCGGEVLTPALADGLLARGAELWNLYGPTEATVWCACGRVRRIEDALVLGEPIAGTQLHVLDTTLQLVPVGVTGELHIGGECLARGYLRQPTLTAERFVGHRLPAQGDVRLYRTGDLVRRRRDGAIEFLGRRDGQVKVRGFRIELGEVEVALEAEPAVRAAIAVVREDEPGDRRLVAYVHTDDGACDAAALRSSLAERLPNYMVPAAIVPLASLPLTPNGKVDRKALPAPAGRGGLPVPAAPRTDVERALTEIAAQVLRRDRVGIDDDFFAIGGDSLLAVRLLARIDSELGLRVPLRALFEAPTVARLARLVEHHRPQRDTPLVRVPRSPRRAPLAALRDGQWLDALVDGRGASSGSDETVETVTVFPTSDEQQRAWFFELLEPDSALYNIPVCLRVHTRLDEPALARALNDLVARHEILRTTLHDHDGRLVQVVSPARPASLAVREVRGSAEAIELARAEVARPFALCSEPPLRALLIRGDDGEQLLCLTLHHIAADARSLELLLDELGALYGAAAVGQPSPPPRTGQIEYGDYAVWQRTARRNELHRSQVRYWQSRLEGPPRADLPLDHPRPAAGGHAGATHTVVVDGELVTALDELAHATGCTLFSVLLAGVDAALLAWTGQTDVVVGTAVAGRTHRAMEDVIGYAANTVALRTDLDGDPSFRELVERARETVVGALEHQEVPFGSVVEAISPERIPGRSPLFDTLLVLQDERALAPRLAGVPVSLVDLEPDRARFDLAISAAPDAGELRLSLEYKTALFEPTTIARFAGQLVAILGRAAREPELPLSKLTASTAPQPASGSAASSLSERIAGLPPEKRELLERLRARGTARADSIRPRRGTGPWPLSSSQTRLWFLEQLAPGLPTYNAALAMRVRGPLDVARLRRSIASVIERHEALRTTFRAENGQPHQVVVEKWSFDLPEIDLRGLAAAERETTMLTRLREESRRPFDLRSDLMLRAVCCRLGEHDRAVVFVEHHIAFDGWSDAALFSELEELYDAEASRRAPRLAELPIQYIDFALWQQRALQDASLEPQRDFWRRELAGAPAHIELPTDRPRPAVQGFAGAHEHFVLPDELAERVRTLSRSQRVTPYMTLLAAFGVLLCRWYAQHDVVVGTPIANRGRVELEPLIGFFSNTLALRLQLGDCSTFREAVARVKRAAVAAFNHQDLPFEKVVEAVRPPRDPSRNPIFQVNFRVQSAAPPALRLPGLTIEPFDLDLGFARFDLALELQLRPDRFCGYVEYNLGLFEADTAAWLVRAFGALLADAVERPDAPLDSLTFTR